MDKAIVGWLRKYLNAGYDLNTLKKTLLQNGYSEKSINDAVTVIYGPAEIKHVIHLSKTTAALIAAVIFTLIIIGGGLFYFLAPKVPSQLLDVRTELLSSSVETGEKLNFNVELASLGAAKRYDVDLRYNIEKDGNVITFKEETVGLETSKSYKTFFEIPADAPPGDYLLKTTARYNGKVARATSSFKVYKESVTPTCSDGIQNQGEEGVDCGGSCASCLTEPIECDDDNECTEDLFVDGECKYESIVPCCGNGNCEQGEVGVCLADCPTDDPFAEMGTWDKLDAIGELAKSNDAKAASYCNNFDNSLHKDKCFDNTARGSGKDKYCNNIGDERTKDECFIAVAEETGNHKICSKIETETRRDRCYMHFAKEGIDYSVCEKVTDYYLKQLCNSMKSLAEYEAGS